jgi:hydrogenase nickel incorporation protein HypA/HybF
MHELSVALSIVDGVLEETNHQSAILAVYLRLGPLSGVAKNALLCAYEMACEGTLLDGSRLIIEDTEVVIYCSSCHRDSKARAMNWLQCSTCGTPASRVVSGKDLEITAVELQP